MQNQPVTGLVVSQIAYERSGSKKLIWRTSAGIRPPGDRFRLFSTDQLCVFDAPLQLWGTCWGQEWWTGDFSAFNTPGIFHARIGSGPDAAISDPIQIEEDALFRRTWRAVSIEQAERRQWLIESRLGWFDAGTLWQEANSHAVYVLGLCDLLELRGARLDTGDLDRLEGQIANGSRYLAMLQDRGNRDGRGDGALVHQAFKFDHEVLPADVAKAAAAWARAAEVLGDAHAGLRAELRQRSRKALDWLCDTERRPRSRFNDRAYGGSGATEAEEGPSDPATPDLLMMLQAELALAANQATPAVIALVQRLERRQITTGRADASGSGLFSRQDFSMHTTKAWTHGMSEPPVPMPADLGNTCGFNLLPLCRLLDQAPEHAEAHVWRKILQRFAYDFWVPACRANPFLLTPYGHFSEEGPLWFAGLWHGCNAIYGQAAALGYELARLFGDDQLREIAEANLQWIAGLNSGMTADSARSCIISSLDVPPHTAVSVSMIHGIGNRTAGSWLNIRGSICNGFSTGEQFKWDVAPSRENDAPLTFSDEDWITHSGAWLMGVARSDFKTSVAIPRQQPA